VDFSTGFFHNDYMMAKSQKAFRRAALPRSKTARLFCHIRIAMSIGRMILLMCLFKLESQRQQVQAHQ
jgi:hypothetical protein